MTDFVTYRYILTDWHCGKWGGQSCLDDMRRKVSRDIDARHVVENGLAGIRYGMMHRHHLAMVSAELLSPTFRRQCRFAIGLGSDTEAGTLDALSSMLHRQKIAHAVDVTDRRERIWFLNAQAQLVGLKLMNDKPKIAAYLKKYKPLTKRL